MELKRQAHNISSVEVIKAPPYLISKEGGDISKVAKARIILNLGFQLEMRKK